MTWYLQYRDLTGDHIERHPSPELVIESACHLLDDGFDVYSIGEGPLTDSVGRDGIAKIYAIWLRGKRPFGDRRRPLSD